MNGLIAHALIYNEKGEFLIIKRSLIKRGKPNYNAGLWDIPGGTVEERELPKKAAIREAKEEVALDIFIGKILYEMSEYDVEKDKVFTTLIYEGGLANNSQIILDPEEHSDYRWITFKKLNEVGLSNVVNYLRDLYSMFCICKESFEDE